MQTVACFKHCACLLDVSGFISCTLFARLAVPAWQDVVWRGTPSTLGRGSCTPSCHGLRITVLRPRLRAVGELRQQPGNGWDCGLETSQRLPFCS